MNNVFLDIETIPSQSDEYYQGVRANITAPAQYKKPESIAKWIEQHGDDAAKEAVAKTSFDPAHGHICCLAFAIGDDEIQHFEALAVEDERAVIECFFASLPDLGRNRIIGHYVGQFDIRFILCRAVVLGVKLPPSVAFPRDPKPWDDVIFDTMTAWAGSKGRISLDNLCSALGVAGKDGFDGSDVADAWKRGEHDRIAEYCKADVERVRSIYRKFEAVGF
jgi:DNA polymerase elongation subunit (family B)